ALHGRCVVGVEGGAAARRKLTRRVREPLRIAAGDDDLAALATREAAGLEPDACATADHDHGLAAQPRLTTDRDVGCCGHASSYGNCGRAHPPSPARALAPA